MAIVERLTDLIGATPLIRLHRVAPEGAHVYAKLEKQNPSGSVKDRAAWAMIQDAQRTGKLHPGGTIVEATSGNTGISLAMIAAVHGYRCIIVMPDDMSLARRHLMQAYGAEVVLTSAEQGMTGSVERARQIVRETPNAFMPAQFENMENPAIHARTTAQEIWADMQGDINAFVTGVGTGGTISGVARALKQKNPDMLVVALEPKNSPVISGGEAGPHAIAGLGAGFVPNTFDRTLINEVLTVSDIAADKMMRRLAKEEGLFVGTSSGANVWGAVEIAKRLLANANIKTPRVVTILCDGGERYLS